MAVVRLSSDDAEYADAPPAPREPQSLDDQIAEAQRLLSGFHSLSASELRAAATNLRTLSNYAEGWAQRTEQAAAD